MVEKEKWQNDFLLWNGCIINQIIENYVMKKLVSLPWYYLWNNTITWICMKEGMKPYKCEFVLSQRWVFILVMWWLTMLA